MGKPPLEVKNIVAIGLIHNFIYDFMIFSVGVVAMRSPPDF